MKRIVAALAVVGGITLMTAPTAFAYPPSPVEPGGGSVQPGGGAVQPPPAATPQAPASPQASGTLPATGGSGFAESLQIAAGLTLVGGSLFVVGQRRRRAQEGRIAFTED